VAAAGVNGSPELTGFVDLSLEETGTIRWLHVDPEARGQGIGTALIERVREEIDTPLDGEILDDAVEGREFLEQFGLAEDEHDWVEIGGQEFPTVLFTEGGH